MRQGMILTANYSKTLLFAIFKDFLLVHWRTTCRVGVNHVFTLIGTDRPTNRVINRMFSSFEKSCLPRRLTLSAQQDVCNVITKKVIISVFRWTFLTIVHILLTFGLIFMVLGQMSVFHPPPPPPPQKKKK